MPTPWKRSPEELHKTYIANTEAFYKVAGRGLAQELDEFVVSCALGLWKGSPRLGQQHVDAVNQLYSKGRKPGAYLLWELTEKVCKSADFLPPLFFWNLTEQGAPRHGQFAHFCADAHEHPALSRRRGRRGHDGRGRIHHRVLR